MMGREEEEGGGGYMVGWRGAGRAVGGGAKRRCDAI